jgi:ParB family chromosome partitioning protein
MVDRRLGRGLDFFLSGGSKQPAPSSVPQASVPSAEPTRPNPAPANGEVLQVPVGKLEVSPFQPRRTIEPAELAELAESIRSSGILQPILARRHGERLEIIAGERRWRAAQLAGLTEVPVLVRSMSDQDAAVASLVENVQREDLNALEKAHGFKALMEHLGTTQEGVAKKVGFERSTVANFLRLLDLPAPVQEHVSRGTLSMGHARSLLALSEVQTMVQLADQAIRQAWSVRKLEAEVKTAQQALTAPQAPKQPARARPVWLNELEENLVDSIGAPVSIRYGRKRSQIIIECSGRDELDRIYHRLTQERSQSGE